MQRKSQRRWQILASAVIILLTLVSFTSPTLAGPPPAFPTSWFPIHKADLADPVPVDDLVHYSIDVGIQIPPDVFDDAPPGFWDSLSWQVEDILPAGLEYVSSSPEGIYDAGQHTIRWELGGILNGATRNMQVTLRPDPSAFLVTTEVTNRAQFWTWRRFIPSSASGGPQVDASFNPEPQRRMMNETTETTTITMDEPPALIPYTLLLRQGKDNYVGNEDTYIDSNNAARNFAHTPWMYLKTVDNTSILSRFDLTGLPAGAEITAAKLRFYVGATAPINAPITAKLFGLLRSWNEDAATWMQAQAGSNWTMPGANGAGDRTGLPDAEVDCYAPPLSPARMIEFDVTTLAQQWLADPSTNFGVTVKAYLCHGTALYYIYSADSRTTERRPELYLEYMAPPAP